MENIPTNTTTKTCHTKQKTWHAVEEGVFEAMEQRRDLIGESV